MTAEVIILNHYGVAMAADSAVSIGDKKVYSSANKLFSLSSSAPVGVMVYGSAKFLDIPWETLIKYFRKNWLADKTFDRLSEYGEEFLSFLSKGDLIPEEHEERFVCSLSFTVFLEILSKIVSKVDAEIESNGTIDGDTTDALAIDVINKWLNEQDDKIAGFPRLFESDELRLIEKKYRSIVGGIFDQEFSRFNVRSLKTKVVGSFLHSLGCEGFRPWKAGVVICGFGESDFYPSAVTYELSGRVAGKLRVVKKNQHSVGLNQRGLVVPFAQREMIDTFLSGVDPKFLRAIESIYLQMIDEITGSLKGKHGLSISQSKEKAIQSELTEKAANLKTAIANIKSKNFSDPILQSVASLPIDELAAMAESLVNLTSFKRKVTLVPESVGGPCDVAVISKGDGFIWIKRKHYFQPELNHRYFKSN